VTSSLTIVILDKLSKLKVSESRFLQETGILVCYTANVHPDIFPDNPSNVVVGLTTYSFFR
jgi:hypothetical protein